MPAKGQDTMQTSLYLAKLIGPTLLVIGIGMLINRDGYRDMAREFLGSRALIYLAGILAFVPGLAMVLAHNVWVGRLADRHHHSRLARLGRRRLPDPVSAGGHAHRHARDRQSQHHADRWRRDARVLGAILSFYGYAR